MNRAFDLRMGESHIEVYKFRTGAIPIATLLALVIQAWLPLHFTRAALLDLPLLVVIYLGLSRRNPSTGLLLGTAVGLMQDSLSGPTVPLGLFGIAKTVIGYLASSLGARLDTEHPAARFALTAGFFIPPHPACAAGTLVHPAQFRRRARQRPRRHVPLCPSRPPPPTVLNGAVRVPGLAKQDAAVRNIRQCSMSARGNDLNGPAEIA